MVMLGIRPNVKVIPKWTVDCGIWRDQKNGHTCETDGETWNPP